MADYGYSCIKLDDDWEGADFIAKYIDGSHINIQLKARLTFSKKYQCKNIYIAFPYKNDWYLFNHNELLEEFLKTAMAKSDSWISNGLYSWKNLSKKILELMAPFKLTAALYLAEQREKFIEETY